MAGRRGTSTVGRVPVRLNPDPGQRHRVVVVGGGVAGLEALIGLRTLAGERVELELISPGRIFAHRPFTIAAAFGSSPAAEIEIEELTRAVSASWTVDHVSAVDTSRNTIRLAGGEERGFDSLVMAPGVKSEPAIPGAITFGAARGTERFRSVLAECERGRISRLVFAVPANSGWPLAIYELAITTAQHLRAAQARVEITLVTPEAAPLAVFGARASRAVLQEFADLSIGFKGRLYPDELAWGELRARPGRVRILADAVVSLPRLRGVPVPGLPHDEAGFIPVDGHGLVRGLRDVYAAGDVTTFPVKHGGLAAQQAGAAAEAIAARAGAAVVPSPFKPVLRGLLLTAGEPRYLEATLGGGTGEPAAASDSPLWWPPTKIAGRYLAPYLGGQLIRQPAPPRAVRVELDEEQVAGA